jgi:ABC-type multidrug transport system fused ATPase/permease subunit
MQDIIRERFQEATVISVAHRLDTILDFDRIVVLDQGRIVEDGNPQELLAQPSTAFKALYLASHAKETEE